MNLVHWPIFSCGALLLMDDPDGSKEHELQQEDL
jgi:hypothetical protein